MSETRRMREKEKEGRKEGREGGDRSLVFEIHETVDHSVKVFEEFPLMNFSTCRVVSFSDHSLWSL